MNANELYRIDSGDGDQTFLGSGVVLRRASADWFTGSVGDWGAAILFVVVDGKYAGDYVALTPKSRAPINEELAQYGHASVVVHRILNPTSSFTGQRSDFDPIGMAMISAIR